MNDFDPTGALAFLCPDCHGAVTSVQTLGEINEASYVCSGCHSAFPIVNGVSRFVPRENYATSFGYQWKRHARTQLDSYTGRPLTRSRFFETTRWPQDLSGQTILEAGCGAGRFTEIAAQTGADVFSFDLSSAVDVNWKNNGHHRNVTIFQADIFKIPLPDASFDKVYCLGVIQHTPDPRAAFLTLARYLKPGGQIAIDVYDKRTHSLPHPKYLLRPITKRIPASVLYPLVAGFAPIGVPLKSWLRRNRLTRALRLSRLIPYYDHTGLLGTSPAHELEWSILDTFDGYSAWHEHAQLPGSVQQWFEDAGLTDIWVGPGPNGISARGTRRSR